MSDTPRTDAAYRAVINGTDRYSFPEFARTLERELDAATLELAHRAGAMDYADKLRDELAIAVKERDEARAELARVRSVVKSRWGLWTDIDGHSRAAGIDQ